jgi:tetratricopeptide (TPR) repeat protein
MLQTWHKMAWLSKRTGRKRQLIRLGNIVATSVGDFRVMRRAMRRFAFTAFVLLGVHSAAAQSSDDTVRSVTNALRAQQYDQAYQAAHTELQKSPHDPKILTLEGLALSGLGKKNGALADYDAALKIAPNYVPALEAAAEIEYNAGSDRALPLLNRLLNLRPDDPTAHAMLAAIAYKRKDCASAVKHFQASGAALSSQPIALEQYGECLVRLKRAEEAIPVFQQLVVASPDDSRARYNLVAVQLTANKNQDAIQSLQSLLDAANPDPDVLDLAAEAYENTGDTPHALQYLRQAIILAPDNPRLYVDFATLSLNHSSYQVGIDMINVGLSKIPDSAALHAARGVLYVQSGQPEKGEADFDAAEKLNPNQAFGSEAYGLASFQVKDLDTALISVRAKLKAHPNDAFLEYLLAQILARQGPSAGSAEFDQAVAAATRAIALNPNLTEARDVLGSLYLKSGQLQKSIRQSRMVLVKEPEDPEALYHLMQALRRTGKTDEIPDLVKRLAAAQAASGKKEAEQNRFRLVEPDKNQPDAQPN